MSASNYAAVGGIGFFLGVLMAVGLLYPPGQVVHPTDPVPEKTSQVLPANTRKLGDIGNSEVYEYRPNLYTHCVILRPNSSSPAISCVDSDGNDYPLIKE